MAGMVNHHSADGSWKWKKTCDLNDWRVGGEQADPWPGVEQVDVCESGFGDDFGPYWWAQYG